jgi:hypothetical protein
LAGNGFVDLNNVTVLEQSGIHFKVVLTADIFWFHKWLARCWLACAARYYGRAIYLDTESSLTVMGLVSFGKVLGKGDC